MKGLWRTIPILLILIACGPKDQQYTSIVGNFRCEENHPQTGYRTYLIEIDRKVNAPEVFIISNFYNTGFDEFVLSRQAGDSLIIDRQSPAGVFVDGTGKIRGDFKRIDWEYEVDDGLNALNIQARYTR